MSCCTARCDDPNCGPCTIYQRFPILKRIDERRAQKQRVKAVLNPNRDGVFDAVSQSRKTSERRKRKGPKWW